MFYVLVKFSIIIIIRKSTNIVKHIYKCRVVNRYVIVILTIKCIFEGLNNLLLLFIYIYTNRLKVEISHI